MKNINQQRLALMAADEKYAPEYYPPDWIKLNSDQIRELPIDLFKNSTTGCPQKQRENGDGLLENFKILRSLNRRF